MQNSSKKPDVASLGKIGEARLDLVPLLADCKPGIRPIEYNVIVAPAPSTEVEGKIGSIFIPDEAKETLDLAMQVGRVIDQSPLAYSYDTWPDKTKQPQIGQIVWFARYAGKEFEGADGKTYRILKDKDIGAVIEEPAAALAHVRLPPDFMKSEAEIEAERQGVELARQVGPIMTGADWFKGPIEKLNSDFQPLHETET